MLVTICQYPKPPLKVALRVLLLSEDVSGHHFSTDILWFDLLKLIGLTYKIMSDVHVLGSRMEYIEFLTNSPAP